jgi:hypothetical protein
MDVPSDRPRRQPRLFAVIVGVDGYDHAGFADLQGAARDARLVSDALGRTHMTATEVVGRLLVSGGQERPARATVVDALAAVAAEAGPGDTVLIHLAGHGVIAGGHVAFAPCDADPSDAASLVTLADIQDLFRDSPCPRRAILLDACQEVLADAADGATGPGAPASAAANAPAGTSARAAARGCRTRGGATTAFVDALRVDRSGWIVVTSCGPGELALESDELDRHGIFSYYAALGLRGEADLDGDGTVGLGELVQYLANKVPWEARRASGGFLTQTPQLVCRGQVSPFTDEGAAAGDAQPVHRRRLAPPPGFPAAWGRAARGRWPFETLTAWRWLILGGAILYGLLMGLETLGMLGTAGAAWAAASGVAAGSAALWILATAYAVAAAPLRYHHGGYVNGAALVAWHAGVFAALVAAGPPAGMEGADVLRRTIHLGAGLFAALCVMVVFGLNPLHIILSLLDLERRREEGVLRDFFAEFDRRLVRAELPCTVACETFHPRIYLVLWLVLTAALLAHMAVILLRDSPAAADGLALVRDAVLWVLLTWQVSGYNATFMQIRRKHPMQVKT